MKKLNFLILLLGFLNFLTINHSRAVTGNDMWPSCSSNGAGCFFYIQGVIEGLVFSAAYDNDGGGINELDICPPAGITREQTTSIVIQYIESHAEMRHLDASLLVWAAMSEAFPCR